MKRRHAPAGIFLLAMGALCVAAQSPAPGPQNGQGAAGEEEVVRVDTVLVSLPVIVSERNGSYVSNLRQEDFQVFEDGVEQHLAHFATVETPFHVALLLDTSGSTRGRLREMREAAVDFTKHLRPGDRVTLISFGGEVKVLAGPTSDREALRAAIRDAPLGDGTPLNDAVSSVLRQVLSREVGRKAAVLLTDGLDNGSVEATAESNLHYAEELDVLIYPVQYDPFVEERYAVVTKLNGLPEMRSSRAYPPGFSDRDYKKAGLYLREMALRTGGHYYHADSTSSINSAFARIAEDLRSRYSLGYYPKNVSESTRRRAIRVKVRDPKLSVRTRSSYIYKQPVK